MRTSNPNAMIPLAVPILAASVGVAVAERQSGDHDGVDLTGYRRDRANRDGDGRGHGRRGHSHA